jgi:hypothetical protein
MATITELGQAIANHPQKVSQVFLGFDLWLDVQTSGKVSLKRFKKGGVFAAEDEPPGVLQIPLQVVGKDIVIAVDITLPPDGFRIAP